MNKKIIIGVVIILSVVGYYFFHAEEQKITEKRTETNWFRTYPQLGVIAKTESSLINVQDVKYSESQANLRGKITNSLGIRDDILEFIVKSVPESNTMAMKAAVKYAQDQQMIYYDNLPVEDAKQLDSNGILTATCLSQYMPDNQDLAVDGINALMRNNEARNQHMWAVDRQYFSWQISGSGLSVADEKIACSEGKF